MRPGRRPFSIWSTVGRGGILVGGLAVVSVMMESSAASPRDI